MEILLEHPEPGMPTLPAELYEKVRSLAPGSAIAKKLAPAFDAGGSGKTEESIASDSATAIGHGVEAVVSPVVEPPAPPPETFRLKEDSAAELSVRPIASDEPAVSAVSGGRPGQDHQSEPIDAETRYALAIAYKDMGLLEEAKEEFLYSMKDAGFFVASCRMMALCFKEQDQSDRAIQILEKLVSDPRCNGENAQIVRYELGLLYEKVSARDRAIAMYQSIPSFQDVPQRLHALRTDGHNGTAAPHQASHRLRALQD